MTPIEKCVSLETAKKLKEAGFPQKTERKWAFHVNNVDPVWSIQYDDDDSWMGYEVTAAPDAQEIGALLPQSIHTEDGDWQFGQRKELDNIHVTFYWNPSGTKKGFDHHNEAEARAACWLYLKEQKLI